MPVTKQEGNFIPTITQDGLISGLKTAFTAAGYGAVYAEFDESGIKNIVYQVVNDESKIFGTLYLHIKVTENLEVGQRLHTDFDTELNVGTNETDYTLSNSLSSSDTLRWIALSNGLEFRWVMLYQGYEQICLGIIRPLGIPSYWDEDIAPYAIVSDVSYEPLKKFFLPEVNPYSNDSYIESSLISTIVSTQRNPFNSEIDILTRIVFAPNSNEGLFGMSSSLLGLATDEALTLGDFIALPDGSEYCTIGKFSGSSSLVVRTTDAI